MVGIGYGGEEIMGRGGIGEREGEGDIRALITQLAKTANILFCTPCTVFCSL